VGQRKLVVHVGNAPDYHSKVTYNFFEHSWLKKLPCPLYLPGISLLDLYLFGKIKSSLIGQQIPDEIDLIEIVTQFLDGISDEELQAVFHSWIECVQNIIDANEGHRSW
jgi:hypothetical protein